MFIHQPQHLILSKICAWETLNGSKTENWRMNYVETILTMGFADTSISASSLTAYKNFGKAKNPTWNTKPSNVSRILSKVAASMDKDVTFCIAKRTKHSVLPKSKRKSERTLHRFWTREPTQAKLYLFCAVSEYGSKLVDQMPTN